jgi:cobalt transporter subunit CbtB
MVDGNSTVRTTDSTYQGVRLAIASKTIAALIAIAIGSAILFTVGFSRGEFIHAAAHDVRHAAGFPCH